MKRNLAAIPFRKLRAGATAVEFAVVVPILLMTIWAGIIFARANMVRHTVENAAYVATRTVIVPGATKAEAIQRAEDMLSVLDIRNAQITFDPSEIQEDTLFVTTEITVPMNENSWGLSNYMKNAVFFGTSTLRTERAPSTQAKGLPAVLNPPPPPPANPKPPAVSPPAIPPTPSKPAPPPSTPPPAPQPPKVKL